MALLQSVRGGPSLSATNVGLEPEKTRDLELGTKWDLLRQRLSATAAVFRTEKTNSRTPGVIPGDSPSCSPANNGSSRVRGWLRGTYQMVVGGHCGLRLYGQRENREFENPDDAR